MSAAQGRASRSASARILRAMLVLQIALAVLVVMADLDRNGFALLRRGDRLPPASVPVRPGDQTRRFDPRLPTTGPATGPATRRDGEPGGPGFPGGDVPSALTFTQATLEGRPGLRLIGAIQSGDADRFARELETMTVAPEVIALHSPGGSVEDALAIGDRLREGGMDTLMEPGAACLSACPYILAAGPVRRISRTALVGVHQHYFGENTFLPAFLAVQDIQRGQGRVMDYLDRMGVDPMLMSKALMTPPRDIYILLPDELTGYRIATELTD